MNKLLLFLLTVLIFSCKAQQIPSSDEAVIIMQKTPCYGSCPEYEMMIFSDRQVVLNAKQYLNMKGKFVSEIYKEDFNALLKAFNEGDFFAYEDRYTSNITDLPTTYLTYRHEGKEKKIMDYHGAPESLKELEKLVHVLIEKLEWEEVKED